MNRWMSKTSAGYATIEAEFEASLRRAFVDHHADFILLDDRRQRFLFESAVYGEEQGWLHTEGVEQFDEQSSGIRYRLTNKGKQHFGILPS